MNSSDVCGASQLHCKTIDELDPDIAAKAMCKWCGAFVPTPTSSHFSHPQVFFFDDHRVSTTLQSGTGVCIDPEVSGNTGQIALEALLSDAIVEGFANARETVARVQWTAGDTYEMSIDYLEVISENR